MSQPQSPPEVSPALQQDIDEWLYRKSQKNKQVFKLLRKVALPEVKREFWQAVETLKTSPHRIGDASASVADAEYKPSLEMAWKLHLMMQWMTADIARASAAMQAAEKSHAPLFDTIFRQAQVWTAQTEQGKLILNEESKQAWPAFSTETPAAFYRKMTQGLPQGTDLRVQLDSDGKLKSFTYTYQGSQGFFDFYMTAANNIITHDHGQIIAAMRSRNISKIINRHAFSFYQAHGIGAVRLSAQDMGAYAWARLGFVPTVNEWKKLRDQLEKRLDFLSLHVTDKTFSSQKVENIRALLRSDDPKKLWKIVDMKDPLCGTTLGKLLLMPLSQNPQAYNPADSKEMPLTPALQWEGVLSMKDADCVARYKNYLFGDKPLERTNKAGAPRI